MEFHEDSENEDEMELDIELGIREESNPNEDSESVFDNREKIASYDLTDEQTNTVEEIEHDQLEEKVNELNDAYLDSCHCGNYRLN